MLNVSHFSFSPGSRFPILHSSFIRSCVFASPARDLSEFLPPLARRPAILNLPSSILAFSHFPGRARHSAARRPAILNLPSSILAFSQFPRSRQPARDLLAIYRSLSESAARRFPILHSSFILRVHPWLNCVF